MHAYQKPFSPAVFYLVPALWLEGVRQPRDLDARELLLFHHLYPDDLIAFPEDRPSAYWVRENDDGLPSLMSQPTYRAYRSALLEPEPPVEPMLEAREEHRECYRLLHWPHFQHKPIYHRPKAYMENRWPVWLGSQWPARVALVGLMALMAEAPVSGPQNEVAVRAATGDIRQAAAVALPCVEVARYVRSGLRELQRLGLVKEHDAERRGVTYRFVSSAFERKPEILDAAIAEQCALDPDDDVHWIALIAAFLRYNGLLLEDAPRVWQKILAYDRHINTEEDALALVAELGQRAGHASTTLTRVLNEYTHRVIAQQRRWLWGNEVAVPLSAETHFSPDMAMPELYGAHSHLQATQLLIHYRRIGRISAEAAAAVVDGLAIDLYQPPSAIPVTRYLRVNDTAINKGTRLNCNHLHREQVDYSQPFRLLIRTVQPDSRVILHCQFRVLAK